MQAILNKQDLCNNDKVEIMIKSCKGIALQWINFIAVPHLRRNHKKLFEALVENSAKLHFIEEIHLNSEQLKDLVFDQKSITIEMFAKRLETLMAKIHTDCDAEVLEYKTKKMLCKKLDVEFCEISPWFDLFATIEKIKTLKKL